MLKVGHLIFILKTLLRTQTHHTIEEPTPRWVYTGRNAYTITMSLASFRVYTETKNVIVAGAFVMVRKRIMSNLPEKTDQTDKEVTKMDTASGIVSA